MGTTTATTTIESTLATTSKQQQRSDTSGKLVIDLDDDNDNDDNVDDVADVRFASTSVKRRRSEMQLNASEQQELDRLENLRAAIYEKARQREQQREAARAKLCRILDDPNSEQYLLLMSFLDQQ